MIFTTMNPGHYTTVLIPDWDSSKEMRRLESNVRNGQALNGHKLQLTKAYGPAFVFPQRLVSLPMSLTSVPLRGIHLIALRAFNPEVKLGLYRDKTFTGRVLGKGTWQCFEVWGTNPQPGAAVHQIERLMVGGILPTVAF